MSLILGIDTSNYTTSFALAEDGEILCNLKEPVFVAEGQRGVRQSDAVFSHVKNVPILSDKIKEFIRDKKIIAVSATMIFFCRLSANHYFFIIAFAVSSFCTCGFRPFVQAF